MVRGFVRISIFSRTRPWKDAAKIVPAVAELGLLPSPEHARRASRYFRDFTGCECDSPGAGGGFATPIFGAEKATFRAGAFFVGNGLSTKWASGKQSTQRPFSGGSARLLDCHNFSQNNPLANFFKSPRKLPCLGQILKCEEQMEFLGIGKFGISPRTLIQAQRGKEGT